MLATHSSSQLLEARASHVLDPPLGVRVDLGLAQIVAQLYNRFRNQQESSRGPEEFVPKWGPTDQDQLAAQVAAVFGIVAESKGAHRGDD